MVHTLEVETKELIYCIMCFIGRSDVCGNGGTNIKISTFLIF